MVVAVQKSLTEIFSSRSRKSRAISSICCGAVAANFHYTAVDINDVQEQLPNEGNRLQVYSWKHIP